MWKCMRRAIHEALGCRVNREWTSVRRLGDVGDENFNENQRQRKGPSFNQQRRNWSSFHRDATDALLGAVSCSSVLALGWVITQPYVHIRSWKCDGGRKCLSTRCSDIFHSLKLTPRNVITIAFAEGGSRSTSKLTNNVDSSPSDSTPYGPLTAAQAIEEAENELSQAHSAILATEENLRGVELATSGLNSNRKRRRQAYNAFVRSFNSSSYPPAAYNIAQCHELGIGTKQDFTLAAQWYIKAAELGHPGAMYNLAVFYAHGWGGLQSDPAKAKELLTRAAELGNSDARAALGYRSSSASTTQPSNDLSAAGGDSLNWSNETDETQEVPTENDSSDYCATSEFESNPEALYQLAMSFEKNSGDSSDAHLVLDLYSFASELGHKAAAAKLQILKAYDAIGLLEEYLWGDKIERRERYDLEHAVYHSK